MFLGLYYSDDLLISLYLVVKGSVFQKSYEVKHGTVEQVMRVSKHDTGK